MSSIREVKQSIQSVTATKKITSAMKMVAAAKLNQAQNKILSYRPYTEKIQQICTHIFQNEQINFLKKYTKKHKNNNTLLVLISSDRGLCGSFNANIYRKYQDYLSSSKENIHVLPIGKKIVDFLKKKNKLILGDYIDIMHQLEKKKIISFIHFLIKSFEKDTYGKILFIYNAFQNAAMQITTIEKFLPFSIPSSTHKKAMYYIYETKKEMLIKKIMKEVMQSQVYKILFESAAAEHGARMTAMNKATDNAEDMLKELYLYYNRTRQAVITNEISEIVAGASSLN